MKKQTLNHPLFLTLLSILYNSEKQFLSYLQVIHHKSSSPILKSLLSYLTDGALSHISPLQTLLKNLDAQPQGVTCEAMNGLIRENLLLVSHSSDKRLKEFTVINFLQQVNRYKITVCASLKSVISEYPQFRHAAHTIQKILEDEKIMGRHIAEAENTLSYSKQNYEQLVHQQYLKA